MNWPVALGLALAGLALLFVLYPLLQKGRGTGQNSGLELERTERRQSLYQQILDIELDRQVGKIGQDDAAELTARLLREAAALLALELDEEREIDQAIEREIRAVRVAFAARSAEPETAQP